MYFLRYMFATFNLWTNKPKGNSILTDMRIFIVGAGQVGYHIASSLVEDDHDLVIIEKSAEKAKEIHSSLDALAVTGDGCDPTLLKQQHIDSADLFFAVSNNDAANLLAALTARKLGAKKCVVRLGDPKYGRNPLLKADDAITALYPERMVAEEIRSLTKVPGVSKVHYFAEGRLVLLQARPSSRADLYGRPLRDLEGPEGWVLTGICRTSGIIIPDGETVLRPGEPVYAVGWTKTIPQFLESIGVNHPPTRKVVIVGAGHLGSWLAKILVEDGIDVAVIQRGVTRAIDLATEVPEALVLRGDATDPALLKEAGIDEADYFVAATQDDETNILVALLARELGARAMVTLYHNPVFLNVLRAAKIDLPVSPRVMIAGNILRMVHTGEITSMDLVEGGDADVLEFNIPEGAKVLKRHLRDLKFPKQAIIGAVIRGEELFVPTGNFRFQKGDQTLVFTKKESVSAVEKMFTQR
jgi:trk system potassium uptake protein TrkA